MIIHHYMTRYIDDEDEYYNTGTYKKSKYMNFKYQQVYLSSYEGKDPRTNTMTHFNNTKPRWRRWYNFVNIENHNKMRKFIKELVNK